MSEERSLLPYVVIGVLILFALSSAKIESPFKQQLYSMTVYPAPIGNTVYGGEQHLITVSIYPTYFDEMQSAWEGGTIPNGCDNVVIEIYAYYPDGYKDKISISKGPLTAEESVGASIYYTLLKDHGQGKLEWFAYLICEESDGGRHLLTSADAKSEGNYWYNIYYPRNPCEGVVCPDKCEGYTRYEQGRCEVRDGEGVCVYDFIETNSPKCGYIDSDGDGIPDPDDQCPYEAGPTENNGCPLPTVEVAAPEITTPEEVGVAEQVPTPVCGNNVCEAGEDFWNCPNDCPPPLWLVMVFGVMFGLIIVLILRFTRR